MPHSSKSFLVKALQHQPQRIKCSLSDCLAFRAPVSIVFLYRKPIDKNLLIDALQHVLCDFPVFAGVLVKRDGALYIDCNNQGAQVTLAHHNGPLFHSLNDIEKFDMRKLIDQIRPRQLLSQRKPVFTMKLTYYTDGMSIGYSWSHSIGDMGTFMELLKTLSAFAQGKAYEPAVIASDRTEYLENWLKNKKISSDKKKICILKMLDFCDLLRLAREFYSPKRGVLLYFTEKEVSALKEDLIKKTGKTLSRNDVLCAHLLDCVTRCRSDQSGEQHLSFAVNMRSRLGLPSRLLGNYVDLISIKIDKPQEIEISASCIHQAVKSYLEEHFQHEETKEFIQKVGGVKKIDRILPEKMLPPTKNLTISNWSNFGAYSIDFGIIAPHLILPVGRSPLPWLSCIMEGFDNKGLLVSLVLPTAVAKRLKSLEMRARIHHYRTEGETVYGL